MKQNKELCDQNRLSVISLLLLLLYPWKQAKCNTEAVQQYLHGIKKTKQNNCASIILSL